MIIINITLSFADSIQTEALKWMEGEYMILLKSCPSVKSARLYQIEAQQGADDCFALQIRFDSKDAYQLFAKQYQQDFESALYAKFQNQFGMFKTLLTAL